MFYEAMNSFEIPFPNIFRLHKNFDEIEYIPKKQFRVNEVDGFFIANSGKSTHIYIFKLKKGENFGLVLLNISIPLTLRLMELIFFF